MPMMILVIFPKHLSMPMMILVIFPEHLSMSMMVLLNFPEHLSTPMMILVPLLDALVHSRDVWFCSRINHVVDACFY
jgi:hypothetical protein